MILNFDEGKISIYYTLHTTIMPEINHYERVDANIRPEEIPDYIGQVKLLQEFIKKITALRRINTDVDDFIREKNMKRDAIGICIAVFVIIFPVLSLIGCLIFLMTAKGRFTLRILIVKKFMRYFEDYEDYLTEMKKNMYFIKSQQKMLIALSDAFRKLFYDKNREMLFLIFRNVVFVVLGMIIVMLFPMNFKVILFFALVGIFAAKYHVELIEYMESKGYKMNNEYIMKKLHQKLKAIEKYIPITKHEKIYKRCFTYENQRWYVGKGFTATTFFYGKLNRTTRVFR